VAIALPADGDVRDAYDPAKTLNFVKIAVGQMHILSPRGKECGVLFRKIVE
jgi:hypothetical protein